MLVLGFRVVIATRSDLLNSRGQDKGIIDLGEVSDAAVMDIFLRYVHKTLAHYVQYYYCCYYDNYYDYILLLVLMNYVVDCALCTDRWIYAGKIEIPTKFLSDIKQLAERLMLDSLLAACIEAENGK